MAAEREVIREFLARLGFTVDEPSFRKFTDRLGKSKKEALFTGSAILGVAAAAEAMVTKFSIGMERMYYASRRTNATVANLSALEYGFGQIGLQAEDALGAVESMAAAVRNNPGLGAVLRKFVGGETDTTKQLVALVRQLKQMPYAVGAQWAEQFGISEKVFQHLSQPGAIEEMERAGEKQREMYRNMGVDQEQAAAASKKFMNQLRELWEMMGIAGSAALINLQPKFNALHQVLSEIVQDLARVDWSNLIDETDGPKLLKFVQEQSGGLRGLAESIASVSTAISNFALGEKLTKWLLAGEAWAFIMGGPNWRNGGKAEPLFRGAPGAGSSAPPPTSSRDMTGEEMAAAERAERAGGASGAGWGKSTPGYPSESGNERLRRAYGQLDAIDSEGGSAVEEARIKAMIKQLESSGFRTDVGRGGVAGTPGPVSMTVHQETNINVSATDAAGAGTAVADSQGRVNRDLADVLRNTAGAVA